MSSRVARVGTAVSAIAIFFSLLTGCRSHRALPALPEVDTSKFLDAVRQPVQQALAEAKARPEDPETNGRLGMILHANGQLAAAAVCYERAASLQPTRFDWLYYRGVAQLSDGRSGDAAATLHRALEIRPNWVPAELKFAQALLDSGDSEQAKRVLSDVQGRNAQNPTALYLYARAANAPEYYEKALAAFPQYGAAMFALAQHYQRSGRVEDASRLMANYPRFKTITPGIDDPFMEALSALNSGPTQLLRQATELEAQGQLSKAAELNEKALELDPNLTQAHVNLISAYGRLGDHGKAEEHYNTAIKQNSNSADAYYNFGVLCYKTSRKREAQQAFQRALEIDPGKAEAHVNLGSVLQEQGRLREATQEFTKAIELRPDNRLARFNLGRILANEGRYDQALDQFSRIITPDDDSTPTYLYAMGATYARAGRVRDAVTTLDRAGSKARERGQTAVAASIERDLARLTK